MRLPIRKPEKYTHLKPGAHITEAKFNELEEKLAKLNAVRPSLAAEVKRLAEMGDFSENAAYQIAKGRLRGINQKILDIEDHLRRAVIIKPNKNTETVQLGHKVTIEVAGKPPHQAWRGDKQKTYLILGSTETNPQMGIISNSSPIGSALMGRKIGDKVKIKIAGVEVEYKIIKIK